jgi:hypothetical protein
MTHVTLRTFVSVAIAALCATPSGMALAVGGGLAFNVDESQIPGALANVVPTDSMDFTYHSCVHFYAQKKFKESGYFWVSSYQDADSAVDSQINYFAPNGYRIYGIYTYKAQQWGMSQPTPSGTRVNYVALLSQPSIELFVDPNQDTTLNLQNCRAEAVDDDISLGSCNALAAGEKSETDGLASGDFEVAYGPNWVFTAAGQALFGNPANFNYLMFNGNVTDLGGALGVDHTPEGSGNIYWLDVF